MIANTQPLDDGDIATWLLFADRTTAEVRERVLNRREEELWSNKALARLREDALASRSRRRDPTFHDPLSALLSRQMKHVTAELEFLRDYRLELAVWRRAHDSAAQREAAGDAAVTTKRKRVASKR